MSAINEHEGTTIQLLCFLTAEFPVQFLTKRYGFKYVLPIMMMLWGTVCEFSFSDPGSVLSVTTFSMVSSLDEKSYIILYYSSSHRSLRGRIHTRYYSICNVFLQNKRARNPTCMLLVNSQRCTGYLSFASRRNSRNERYWRQARVVLAILNRRPPHFSDRSYC
jgi:hypothetical protein